LAHSDHFSGGSHVLFSHGLSQGSLSTSGGQFPPLISELVFFLFLVLTPAPHVVEQLDHEDQLSTTQSTGHALFSQDAVSLATPMQLAPPSAGSGQPHDLERFCSPVPHEAEHGV